MTYDFSHLTREDIDSLTMDVVPSWWPWQSVTCEPTAQDSREALDALHERVRKLFTEVSSTVTTMREQFVKDGRVEEALFQRITGFSPYVRICAWYAVRTRGVDDLDFIKHVHVRLMAPLLDVFNMKPGEAGMHMVPKAWPGFIARE